MKTAKQFLKDKGLKDTLYDVMNSMPDQWVKGGLSKLLDEYAESKVKKFHKPPVRGSVCGCNPKTSHWLDKKTGKDMCMKCSKEIAN